MLPVTEMHFRHFRASFELKKTLKSNASQTRFLVFEKKHQRQILCEKSELKGKLIIENAPQARFF